ncbi:MAG: metalloregulator ArsR/SmtB family transcription factor [Candidatus Kapabacteria bacterium]|nr:metalloregulator ArsR/SmtB family transcription factor [Candidatus Kapabacteria bacterium]MDW8226035.1 metalloregulator ArsR/SmtB family transcription factor [Bacteroidota bacterium]
MKKSSQRIVQVARALSEPTRLRLVQELSRRGSMLCMEIQQFLRLAQPTVSHHIKILLEADLVEAEKQGRHVRIRLKAKTLAQVYKWVRTLIEQVEGFRP